MGTGGYKVLGAMPWYRVRAQEMVIIIKTSYRISPGHLPRMK